MNKNIGHIIISQTRTLFLALVLATVFTVSAHAATVTWDGEGADDNFSTAANWSGDTLPVNGDDLVFPTSVDADTTFGDDRMLNNDLVSFSAASISVTGNYATDDYDYYQISGNDITVTGDILANDTDSASPRLDLAMNVTLGAPATLRAVRIDGSLAIGANDTAFEASTVSSGISGTGTLTIDSTTNGSGGGSGGGCTFGAVTETSPIDGDSSGFSGAIVIAGNNLIITPVANHLGSNASSITLSDGGFLTLLASNGADLSVSTPITLNGGGIFARQLPADGNCDTPEPIDVTLSADITATADVAVHLSSANLIFSGTTTGADFIALSDGQSKASSLTVNGVTTVSALQETEYSGDQSSTYPYASDNQRVVVAAGATVNNATVAGGELFGAGTVGSIVMTSGSVNPGLSPGCLSSGDLSYTGGSLEIEIAGTTVCTEYDQQDVTGTVDLGSATDLNVTFLSSFVPAVGNTFTIISNDGSDAVTGTFASLAEGAEVVVDGVTFTISYVGGDGNDIVLTVTEVPAEAATPDAPDTGFARIASANPLVFAVIALLAVVALGIKNPVKVQLKK